MTYPFAGEIKMTKVFRQSATEWARVDKDLNVTHLDMDLCRKGPQNEYTALAIAIWDAATKADQKEWQGLTDEELFAIWMKSPAETEDRFAFVKAVMEKLKERNT